MRIPCRPEPSADKRGGRGRGPRLRRPPRALGGGARDAHKGSVLLLVHLPPAGALFGMSAAARSLWCTQGSQTPVKQAPPPAELGGIGPFVPPSPRAGYTQNAYSGRAPK